MTDRTLIESAFNLVSALDLPSDAPASASARLITIAKDPSALAELVVAFKACETITMGEREEHAPPWRKEGLKTSEKWQAVCATFPSLMVNPFTKEAIQEAKLRDLEQIARRTDTGNGCKHAVRFVLQLWNPGFDWECGKFELTSALRAWDDAHRAALTAWLADPWWP